LVLLAELSEPPLLLLLLLALSEELLLFYELALSVVVELLAVLVSLLVVF
jgi:hypothetical protein